MANNPTVVIGSLNDEELKKSIDKLVNHVDEQLNYMVSSTKVAVMSMNKSLKSLGDTKVDFGGSADGGASKRAKAQNAETVAVKESTQVYKEKTLTLDQQSSVMNTAIQSSQRYTEEIRKQAAAIRATEEWKKTGRYWIGDTQIIDPSVYIGTKKEREAMGTLEEQLLRIQKAQKEEIGKQVKEEKKLAETVAQTAKTVSYKRDLQMSLAGFGVKYTQDVTNEQVKQYQTLEEQLKKLKASYASMNEEAKKSEQGIGLSKSITDLQKQRTDLLNSIKSQLSEGRKTTVPDQFASLRQSIANVLGVQKENISLLDIEKTSSERLTKELKMLQLAYSKLSASRIAKGDGTDIANEIQRVQRALQKLQATQTRPTSLKSVMGLDEKTLDDIAYKMRQLASYRSGLNVETQVKEIEQVNKKYAQLQKNMNDIMQKNTDMIASNTALGRSWNYMKNRLAFYFTVGASTSFVKNLIEIRSQYEMNERALGILINSAERGTQIFNELSQMALVSPYTLIELSAAAKQLTAYDVAAKDVVDTTRRLADMAAAVGIPIERLTYALGQIKAYGYLNSRDARMFANAGIPLVKQLSEYYSQLEGHLVSTADVYDRIKKKTVDYTDVVKVINNMTDEGGKFFDFQAKMAETLKVQLANLTLAWNNMLNDIGSSSQGLLSGGIGLLKEIFLQWRSINNVLSQSLWTLGLFKTGHLLYLTTLKKVSLQAAATTVVGKKLTDTFVSFGKSLKSVALTPTTGWVALLAVLVNVLQTVTNNREALLAFNKAIVDGAKESEEAISEFLDRTEIAYARVSARAGKLSKSDASKTWDVVREQLELSAASSDKIIAELLDPKKFKDTNERLTAAFETLEKIRDVSRELAEVYDSFDISQDTILYGLFGEGLVEDINDYNDALRSALRNKEYIKDYSKNVEEAFLSLSNFVDMSYESLRFGFSKISEILGDSGDEAKKEAERFARETAKTIRDELGAEMLKDPVMVNEAVAALLKSLEKQYPQIQGNAKTLFESVYYDTMSEEFSSAVDKQEYYYKLFLDRLKKDHSSAFSQVTDGILEETHRWESGQIDAINRTAEKIKKDLPESARDAIDRILTQLNTTEFKLRIVAELATTAEEDVQKQFRKRFIESNKDASKQIKESSDEIVDSYNKIGNSVPWRFKNTNDAQKSEAQEKKEAENLKKYGTLMQKTGETTVEYEKRIRDERQKNLDIVKAAQNQEKQLAGKKDEASLAILAKAKEEKETAQAYLDAAEEVENWGGYDFSTKKENAAARKEQVTAEKELSEAFKNELSVLKDMQTSYNKLRKSGVDNLTAINLASKGYENTLNRVNATLAKYGISKFNAKDFLGKDVNAVLRKLQAQRDEALASGKLKSGALKELDVRIKELRVEVETYNLDMITKGLNNELGKLKDEYELAVAIDADPELGNAFADMMGINVESLPHTIKEYADEYSKYLNKFLKGKNSSLQFTGDELRGLTRDDITAFREQVDAGSFNQEWFDEILKAYKDISGKRKKDLEDTEKWKNGLIEKYGNLQDKLTKIYKDSIQNQVNAVKTFGTEDQKSEIERLKLRIEVTDNPAELAEINTRIADIVKDVTDKNPIALKLVDASNNQTKVDTSKAYWEDFKNSELYAMTFEDMANNSTRAIQLIMDKLEGLKDKVKEDPASMKALMKSLEDAEKELSTRDPFGGIARSLRDMATASQETKSAQEALWRAEADVEQAQQEVDNAQDGTPEEQAAAQQKLTDAVQRRAAAQVNLTNAENKGKKGTENMRKSLQGMANQLQDVSGLFGNVSQIFKMAGDEDTSEAIDAINEGFTTMVTIIMAVDAAIKIMSTTNPYLLAIAAALSVIVGLVSFLSGNSNKKITEQVEESERTVKRLEIAYKRLEVAIEESYGSAKWGAQQAAIANKKLQLAEVKRQLALERSRDSKDRDEDKINDLIDKVEDLKIEIEKSIKDITNDLLGISSVGNAAEELVSSMIDAFRRGEDYMLQYDESFEKMIDNMIMKSIVGRVIGDRLQSLWDMIDASAKERGEPYRKQIEELMAKKKANEDSLKALENGDFGLKIINEWYLKKHGMTYADWLNQENKNIDEQIEKLQKQYSNAIAPTPDDVSGVRAIVEGWKDGVQADIEAWMDAFDITFGQDSDKQLSALQQGIQGVSEETAGALEAYMNGVSQQVYYQSDLLTQIRDAVVGFDMDASLGVQAQMLLQLQQSYAVQMAIQGILEGWNNPSGQAVRVELVS